MIKYYCWSKKDLVEAGYCIGENIDVMSDGITVKWTDTDEEVVITPVSKNGVTHYLFPQLPKCDGGVWTYYAVGFSYSPDDLLEVPHTVNDFSAFRRNNMSNAPKKILNLTNHELTPQLASQGVIDDISNDHKERLSRL